MFQHFLITRFNVRIKGMGPEIIESPPLDEAWMKTRLHYFIHYCAKSVCAQTNHHFTWLVYFDADTPESVFQQIATVTACGKQITTVKVADFDHMLQDLRLRIRQQSTPYIITSRLDNDDLIHPEFIARVQAAFQPVDMAMINFNAGYEYDPVRDLLKKWNQRLHNQFISLVEKRNTGEPLTVYGFPHWGPPKEAVVINLEQPAAWMHLRHTNNYSLNTYKAIPVFNPSAAGSFGIGQRKPLKMWWHTLRYTAHWFPRMVWRRISNRS